MEDCTILNETRVNDAFGGWQRTWVDGATFKAAFGKISSPEIVLAEQQGVSETFKVVVEQGFELDYHDVFRRNSDGSIFRTISRTAGSTAHPASTVKISTVDVERWELPS